MKRLFLVLIALALIMPLSAQAGGSSGTGFTAGLNLGSDLLPNPGTGVMESWSKIGFQPDLAIGKFGVGLDLTIRFQLYPTSSSNPLAIYSPDWIPTGSKTIFDVYLPKILYVRYGLKGIDPLYAKLGSINDFTLGNGLIISDYSNMHFLPDLRLFGLQAGVDGSLFKVPYFGLDLLTGNLAKLDVVGGRFYLRPLGFMGDSILGRLQLGGTGVVDRAPYLYNTGSSGTASLIYEIGADITDPLITGGVFSLTAYVEGAKEMNSAMGAAGGIRGKLISLIDYGAQVNYFQAGFIPSYFDANYDFYRPKRYDYIMATSPGGYVPGWQANLGFDLFSQKFTFGALLSGPFDSTVMDTNDVTEYPHLKGTVMLAEGLISGLSAEGKYEKYFIGRRHPFFQDLIDPTDAAIGFAVHYKTGATVLTLDYAYRWNPAASAFDVSSSLSAEVRF
ncbi:MAG: hypothetical protein NT061_02225 [Spirochaetes bacterium]|nr:hypothetical protein [Spirochaetota bacterium]